jgi:DNA polymerase-3 subunit delta'
VNLDYLQGNEPLKESIRAMLASRRLTHSILLVGEQGVGKGFAARCIAADYLYPAGGAAAQAMLRGDCCKAVAKAGSRDSGHIETGVVREAISVTGAGSGGRYIVGQVMAMRSEIFNTGLSSDGRVVLLYHVERMNEESANALLKVMEEPPEGVLFILTADSLAGVLPTIRSRCISFAVAPVSPAICASYCQKQGVPTQDARTLSEIFDGHIGTVLAAANDPASKERLTAARQLAQAAAAKDGYTAAVLLTPYEKDKAGATALLRDFAALTAAGLRQSELSPLQGKAAQRAIRAANEACGQLAANQNAKLVLTVLAVRLGKT